MLFAPVVILKSAVDLLVVVAARFRVSILGQGEELTVQMILSLCFVAVAIAGSANQSRFAPKS